MVGIGFDELAKALAESRSRRAAGRALVAGAVLGLVGWRGLVPASAHHFGCRHVGKRCARDRQCCSGRCRGRNGKQTCRGHHAGTCKRGQNVCTDGDAATCNGQAECPCLVTTGGAPFCAAQEGSTCVVCQRDFDCVLEGFPPGSACVRVDQGSCEGCPSIGISTGCFKPCAPADENGFHPAP